jgi:hypothetical protein
MDYMQLTVYLTDVNQETHCFSLSPESANAPILNTAGQLDRNGIVDCRVVEVTAKFSCFLIRVIILEFRWYDGTISQKCTRTVTIICLYSFTLVFCNSDSCCMENSNIKQYYCTSHPTTIYNAVSIQCSYP